MLVVAAALMEPALSQECEPPPEQDPPPVVVGFPLADAEKALSDWDPEVDVDRLPEPSDDVDVALVIVRAQSDVSWICSEPVFDDVQDPAFPRITLDLGTIVPDLVGERLAEARELLRSRGLLPVGAPDAALDRPVVAQDPRAGEAVALGTPVTVQVPTGGDPSPSPGRVAVPSIVGLTPEAAREAVEGAGLVFRGVREGDGPEVGRVIAQDPPPRTLVRRGREVVATIEMVAVGLGTPISDEGPLSTWLPILVGAAIGIAAAMLISSVLRARRRRSRGIDRVVLDGRPDIGRVTLAEDIDGGRSFALGFRSRSGATWFDLEEEEEVPT